MQPASNKLDALFRGSGTYVRPVNDRHNVETDKSSANNSTTRHSSLVRRHVPKTEEEVDAKHAYTHD